MSDLSVRTVSPSGDRRSPVLLKGAKNDEEDLTGKGIGKIVSSSGDKKVSAQGDTLSLHGRQDIVSSKN